MDSSQELGTERLGDPERCGCSPQSVLSLQPPPGSKGFAPICPDRESYPPDSDSAGTQASSAPLSCLRGMRKRHRLRVRFQAPPSPVLFSSDDHAVSPGEEEYKEVIGCPDQGGASGEGAKDKPRGFTAEEPGGWMDYGLAWG